MPKLPQQTPEEQLESLRAQLEVAEHAASAVPEDAEDEVKAAAEAHRAAAESALADAHLKHQKRQEAEAKELRLQEERRSKLTLQELIQAGSTQNVRGTHELSPEEHAARRNPEYH